MSIRSRRISTGRSSPPLLLLRRKGGSLRSLTANIARRWRCCGGQEKGPCQVVQADRAKQAAAYAAVNGNITKPTAQQLYHSRLAAKKSQALALAEVCAAGFGFTAVEFGAGYTYLDPKSGHE